MTKNVLVVIKGHESIDNLSFVDWLKCNLEKWIIFMQKVSLFFWQIKVNNKCWYIQGDAFLELLADIAYFRGTNLENDLEIYTILKGR